MKTLQIITPTGKVNGKAPQLPKETLLRMYKSMVLTRTFDARALKLQRSGRIGFYVSSEGQEAAAVGAAAALGEDDWIFPTYRDPGMAIFSGANLTDMMNQNFGNAHDLTKGRQMPVHYSFTKPHFVSISSPLGTQIGHAVGMAMGAKYRKEKIVALACMGEGGTSLNDFHAGLNFAGVYQSPVVFFCQNNQWAISVPVSKQTASESIAAKGQAYGMPGVKVDGNDVLAVYQVVKQAVDRARKGGGPTLIEAFTYRISSHSSSDDWTRYRSEKEVAEWRKKDPIARFEKFLTAKKLWTKKLGEELAQWADDEVGKAIKEAAAVDQPSTSTMFEDVYRDIPAHLQEQWEELKAVEASGMAGNEEEGFFPL